MWIPLCKNFHRRPPLRQIYDSVHDHEVASEERGFCRQIVSYRFDSIEYEDMTAQQMYQKLKGQLSKSGTTHLFPDGEAGI